MYMRAVGTFSQTLCNTVAYLSHDMLHLLSHMHVHYTYRHLFMMCIYMMWCVLHCCDSVQTLRVMWRLQLASRIPLSPDLQCLRTHLPLTLLPLTRSYQPLVEEEEEEEEEEYLRSDTLTCVSITV